MSGSESPLHDVLQLETVEDLVTHMRSRIELVSRGKAHSVVTPEENAERAVARAELEQQLEDLKAVFANETIGDGSPRVH